METEVITQLSAPGSARTLDPRQLEFLGKFFKDRFLSNLGSARLHPLGFFYVKEYFSETHTFRYHVWPTGSSIPASQIDSDIHDHVFELNSAVLAGTMRHETFSFIPATDGDFDIATVVYNGSHSTMHREGNRGNLRTIEDVTFSSGKAYRLPAYTIHRARPVSLPTATIVLAVTEKLSQAPRIAIRHPKPEPAPFDRRLLNDSEISLTRETLNLMHF